MERVQFTDSTLPYKLLFHYLNINSWKAPDNPGLMVSQGSQSLHTVCKNIFVKRLNMFIKKRNCIFNSNCGIKGNTFFLQCKTIP